MTLAYVGLGANLGDARGTLQQAAARLAKTPGIDSVRLSGFYRSAPVGASGPDYVNAVAAVETTLSPASLLSALQEIEREHGRERLYRNAPRTLDLDLLLYGGEVISQAELIVPHPRMHQRAFVLLPLYELAPSLRLEQGDLQTLIAQCADQRLVRLTD